MHRIQGLLANLFLISVGAVIAFLFLEFGARIYVSHVASYPAFMKYASYRDLHGRGAVGRSTEWEDASLSPHRFLGWYNTPGYERNGNRHNSLGFRGEEIALAKPAGEYRIVCLGGSTTYTAGVSDYRQSYPDLLEQELANRGYEHVRVINAGASGYTTWETLINLAFRVLDLEPDMIIVYHGVNDARARLVWPPEFYRGDASGFRGAVTSVFMPSLLEYSTVLRILMIRAGLIESHASLARFDSHQDSYYGDDFRNQVSRGEYPTGIFNDVLVEEILRVNKPTYFRRNLESLIAISRAHDVETVLATFAYARQPTGGAIDPDIYQLGLNEMNAVIEEVANSTGVPLFDFAGVFPQDPRHYGDSHHVNEEGAELKAELFAGFLTSNGLIPSRETALEQDQTQ